MTDSVYIDGSMGGGQILRSSLSLSLLTGRPLSMGRIRAIRSKPGLARQHLTAVRAAAEVGRASLSGARLRSKQLRFTPTGIFPGDYRFEIGTAGSTTLVLQTLLPALCLASGPSRVVVEGGTHNGLSPSFEFLQRSFVPLLERMGPRVRLTLDRHGFFPKGGGRVIAEVQPVERLEPLHLQRGEVEQLNATAVVSLLPTHIARRELEVLSAELDIPPGNTHIEEVHSRGPGNACWVEVRCAGLTAHFTGFGQKGVPAERIAHEVAVRAREWLESGTAAEEHLQDQLLLPLALAGGGSYTTVQPSDHSRSSLQVIQAFLGTAPRFERHEGWWRAEV